MALGLKDFAGRWRLDRRIRDAQGDREGRFRGDALFRPEGATLFYRERGELTLDGREMAAEQSHVWRQEGNRICVVFADGRPFHTFELGVLTPEGRHVCAPDLYRVLYDFGAWPEWRSEWRVSGPRKDYTLTTRYVPAD